MCDHLLQITSNDFAELGFLDHWLTQSKKLFYQYFVAQKRAFRILFDLNMKKTFTTNAHQLHRYGVGVIITLKINETTISKTK